MIYLVHVTSQFTEYQQTSLVYLLVRQIHKNGTTDKLLLHWATQSAEAVAADE
jgi:hypothetical protein